MNNEAVKIHSHSRVTLHHQLGVPEGTILEDTFDAEPLVIQLGSGELAEGLEFALIDLAEGDEQTIDINPELAFGFVDETLIVDMERSEFDADIELQEGLILEFSTPNDDFVPGTILSFDEKIVKVDLNHPLAGQVIRYRVKIVSVDNTPVTLN